MGNIGRIHASGEGGLPENDRLAEHWYLKAIEHGASDQRNLAVLYLYSDQLDFQPAKALKLLNELGKPQYSCVLIGSIYMFGIGVERDFKKALQVYQEGAKAGSVECFAMPGMMAYYYGEGKKSDREKGLAILYEAKKMGSVTAKAFFSSLGM